MLVHLWTSGYIMTQMDNLSRQKQFLLASQYRSLPCHAPRFHLLSEEEPKDFALRLCWDLSLPAGAALEHEH
jgi:hypothetical protein